MLKWNAIDNKHAKCTYSNLPNKQKYTFFHDQITFFNIIDLVMDSIDLRLVCDNLH